MLRSGPLPRLRARLSTALLMSAMLLTFLAVTPAQAATTRCEPGSGTYSGRCYVNTTTVSKKSIVVEQVPLQNWSSKTVTMSCGFTQTVTRSMSGTVSLSATAKATIFGLVDVSTSVSVSMTVSQTASQATTAGGSVVLSPGESVVCQRIYTWVTQGIKETTYSGSYVSTRTYSVTVPSTLGVRLVDG